MCQISVVISDCHEFFREGVYSLLEQQEGFSCIAVACNREETTRLTLELSPDLLLLDISSIKEVLGDLLSDINSLSPKTRTIVLTHSIDIKDIAISFKLGVFGYLTKDIEQISLIHAMRMIYAGQKVFSPIVSELVSNNIYRNELININHTLKDRELQIIKLASLGKSNKEIGIALDISEHTVASHLINIFRKLGVGTRTQAILHCVSHKWIE